MTHRRIDRKSTESNYVFSCIKQYTSGTHSHILAHSNQLATTEGRPNSSTTHCKGKYNLIPRKSNDKDGRFHHIQNKYQFHNFHTRRKICWMGHRKLLTRNTHGMVIIYEDEYQIHSTRNYQTLQLK